MKMSFRNSIAAFFLLAGVGAHGVTLELAAEDSTFVCLPGETARVALRVAGDATPQEAALEWVILDHDGRAVEAGAILGPGALYFEPQVTEPGYYDFRCKGRLGDQEIAPLWGSIVRLGPQRQRTQESPFGLYKHGNLELVAAMKPLGYYRYFAKTGGYWVTTDMWWNKVQPAGPEEWNWTHLDQEFADAREHGLQLVPHLFGVPDWASSYEEGGVSGGDGHKHAVYPPKAEAWDAWRAFVGAFVERYKDDLKYLRIWNEFDTAYWMGSYKDFAQLLQIAYEEAHRIKPDISIVIDVALAKLSVFDALVQEGGGPYFDVLSIHNYQLNNLLPPEQTSLIGDYEAARAWRDKHFPDRQVWESEICWLAEPWSFPSWYGNGERAQAQYAARGQLLALMSGMEKVIWFPYHSWAWEEKGKSFEHGGALLRHNMTPRPSFASYATMTSQLQNARFTRRLEVGSDTAYVLEFADSPERTVTVLWSADAETEQLTLQTEEKELTWVDMLGAERSLFPVDGLIGVTATASPAYLVSNKPLAAAVSLGLGAGFKVTWEVSPSSGTGTPIALAFENADGRAKCLYAELEGISSPERGFPLRVNLYQGRDATGEAQVLLPSQSRSASMSAHLRVWEEGDTALRFPLRFELPIADASEWTAPSAQTPVEYSRALGETTQVEGALLSLRPDTAYDVALEGRTSSAWVELAPFAVRSGASWIPIGREISELRVRFRQLIHDASLEGPGVLHQRGPEKEIPPNQWNAARNRPYIELVSDAPHSGTQCVEINAMDAGRGRTTNEFSQVEQVISVRPNTYYTFSAYAKMPKTQDAWAAVFIVGETPEEELLPHSFVVLPYVDDEWHRVSLTVRTESYHDKLRMSCTPIANGLVYFDDMTAIEGTLPTDVPEIECLDVYARTGDGALVLVSQ